MIIKYGSLNSNGNLSIYVTEIDRLTINADIISTNRIKRCYDENNCDINLLNISDLFCSNVNMVIMEFIVVKNGYAATRKTGIYYKLIDNLIKKFPNNKFDLNKFALYFSKEFFKRCGSNEYNIMGDNLYMKINYETLSSIFSSYEPEIEKLFDGCDNITLEPIICDINNENTDDEEITSSIIH